MNKKYFYSLILTLLLFIPLVFVQAAGLSSAFGPHSYVNTVAQTANYKTNATVTTSASHIILLALRVVGIIFIFLIVYAGIEWMTAGGNESRRSRSQEILRAAIVGLIIVLIAYAISYFIIKTIGSGLIT